MKKYYLIFFSILFPTIVLAQDKYGLGDTAAYAGLIANNQGTGVQTLPQMVGNIIGTGLSLIAIMFFVLVVYGGITWMTARGNEEQTKKALNTITAAIIGMIVVMASYTITSFVFQNVGTGAPASSGSVSGGGSAYCCPCPGSSNGSVTVFFSLNASSQSDADQQCRQSCPAISGSGGAAVAGQCQ